MFIVCLNTQSYKPLLSENGEVLTILHLSLQYLAQPTQTREK